MTDGLPGDIAHAIRSVRHDPGFALAAILTLALGIGANTAVFSVLHGVVLSPLPYPEAERLVFITSQLPLRGVEQLPVSPAEFVEFRANNGAFASVGAYRLGAANLGADHPIRPVTAAVSEDLFLTLRVAPLRGRTFTRADTLPGAEPVVILSYRLYQDSFAGSDSVLGQLVPVDGQRTRVVGVMPAGTDVHDSKVDLWLPLTLPEGTLPARARTSHMLYVVGRLRDGVTIDQACADLERLLERWPNSGGGTHQPDQGTHRLRLDFLHDDIVRPVTRQVWVLQAAVGFVLLVACANLASLILARAEVRRREHAVRAALGAGRLRLARQFFAEGVFLSLVAGSAGIGVAWAGLDALLKTTAGIPRAGDVRIDVTVLAFSLVIATSCTVLFTLVPLARLSGNRLYGALQEAGFRVAGGRGGQRARRALVAAEIAAAVVLVTGAGLMTRTFWNLMDVDAGFDRSRMVTFAIVLPTSVYETAEQPRFFTRLLEKLSGLAGVDGAAAMSGLPPLRNTNAWDTDFEDVTPAEAGQGGGPVESVDFYQYVSVNYVQTMGIPVVEGRDFLPSDIEGPPVVLVNETLARTFFPGRSAVGRRVRPGFREELPWFTIVGVLKDVKQQGVGARAGTELYHLNEQLPRVMGNASNGMNIVLRTSSDPATIGPVVQDAVRSLDASLPLGRIRTMEEVSLESLVTVRSLAVLLGVFAGLALLLAAVGVFGVMSGLVAERRHEIGVRMALGAGRRSVLGLILARAAGLIVLGLAGGLACAVVLTRLLQTMLFGLQPTDPGTLAATALLIAATGLGACLLPAVRATLVDPIVVLRRE